MSLVISSTTDTQEDVNAAAGIETDAGEAQTQEPTPAPAPAKAPPEEPDEEDDENGGEDPEPDERPKRKGGFQRKIEALERERDQERWYAQKRIEDLQAQLAGQRKPAGETRQPDAPKERPTLEQFQDYDEYVEALADWKTEQKIEQRERELARQAREWHAQEQQRQLMSGWQQRIGEFRSTAGDFDDVLAAVEHIEIPPEIQRALIEYDNGPQLAYALAKEPKELARIARIESPRAALRELGKFEARMSAQAAPARPPVSRAPEPIRPVGGGAATSSKPVDQMSYQEYKAYREREIAAKKRRAA